MRRRSVDVNFGEVGGLGRSGWVWEGGETYAASCILHHEHEGAALWDLRTGTLVVQRRQTDAVALEAVGQRPRIR